MLSSEKGREKTLGKLWACNYRNRVLGFGDWFIKGMEVAKCILPHLLFIAKGQEKKTTNKQIPPLSSQELRLILILKIILEAY